MLTSASIHVFYTFVRVWVTEALFTNHKLECCQTSLAKSTLLKNAQRKRNLFWRIFLCLPSPARAEYAIILQPNYKLEQRPAEGNQLHRQTYSRKTFRESTTEYFNALRVLKLEVLVRITKIKTRLDHTLTCKMHTSASSHGSYTFVRVWVMELLFTNHTRECSSTSLAKSTLLQYSQRKRNLFWKTCLCLDYPKR